MQKITLKVKWSKKENNFVVCYPRKQDGAYLIGQLIHSRICHQLRIDNKHELGPTDKFLWNEDDYTFFEHNFIKELENRGYDITTFSFSIQIDPLKLKSNFPHIYETLTKKEKKKLGIT